MDLGLKGRRALVLAATRGLGRAIAEGLAAEGAHIALCGRHGVDEAAAKITAATGATVHGLSCDLFDQAATDATVDLARERLGGPIDVLVLNGGGPPPSPALDVGVADWKLWFDRMAAIPIHVANRLVPAMREQGWGRVLSVASSAAIQPIPHMALSNAVRATLLAWNKTLAAEVAPDGVTCNVVVPGRIHTDRVDALDEAKAKREGKTLDQVRAEAMAGIPAGRYGRPDEFAAMAVFLASERASYVTGSVIRVDGGSVRAL